MPGSVKGIQRPDANGRFGKYGGKYVPETLIAALEELETAYAQLAGDKAFQVRPCAAAAPACRRAPRRWRRVRACMPRSAVAKPRR